MRDGWNATTLGRVADTRLGKTLPRGSGADVDGQPYLRNINVQWGRIVTKKLNRMVFSPAEQERLQVRAGDILVCEGGEVGRLTFVEEDLDGIYFQNALHRVRIVADDALPKYVALALENFVRTGGLDGITTRVTIAHLNQAKLRALPIILPPLFEQRRIVDLIGALDNTIAAAAELYAAIQTARSSACTAVQHGAESLALDTLATVSQGRSLPKSVQGRNTGSTPWFKIADMAQVRNVHGYTTAETSLSGEEVERLGGRIVPVGAVVFPRVGAAVQTEKKRVMTVPGALDENHLILTPREGVPSELLLAVMEKLSLSGLVQSGAVPSLNMGLIRATRVPWPVKETKTLGTLFGQLRRCAADAAQAAARLRELRSNLLTALLSGEHEILESYDDLMGA